MKVTSVIQHKYRQVNELLIKCRVIVFAKIGPLQASCMVKYQAAPPHSKGCLSAKDQKPKNDEEERFMGNWFGDGILWEIQYIFIITQMKCKWMLE